MASAQIVETSVTNNSPSQDSYHPDDLFQSRTTTTSTTTTTTNNNNYNNIIIFINSPNNKHFIENQSVMQKLLKT